jgi:hypothetical protein
VTTEDDHSGPVSRVTLTTGGHVDIYGQPDGLVAMELTLGFQALTPDEADSAGACLQYHAALCRTQRKRHLRAVQDNEETQE